MCIHLHAVRSPVTSRKTKHNSELDAGVVHYAEEHALRPWLCFDSRCIISKHRIWCTTAGLLLPVLDAMRYAHKHKTKSREVWWILFSVDCFATALLSWRFSQTRLWRMADTTARTYLLTYLLKCVHTCKYICTHLEVHNKPTREMCKPVLALWRLRVCGVWEL